MYFPLFDFLFQTVTFICIKDLVWHDPAKLVWFQWKFSLDEKYVVSSFKGGTLLLCVSILLCISGAT